MTGWARSLQRFPSSPFSRWYGFTSNTFWYVVPTLPMFLAFPALLGRIGFWPTLIVSVVLTIACFAAFALVVRRFGIELL